MEIIKEAIVAFETAKLLKEKGFTDIIGTFRGKHYYNYKGELDGDCLEEIKHRNLDDIELYKSIPAPTLSLAQQWLREVHNIHVEVWFDNTQQDGFPYVLALYKSFEDVTENNSLFGTYFDTYEETLEAGIIEALKLI